MPNNEINEYPFILGNREGGEWRPTLPVEFMNSVNGSGVLAYAYLDTGASQCMLPFERARDMGVNLDPENVVKLFSAGQERIGYGHTIELKVFGAEEEPGDNVFVKSNVILCLKKVRIVFVRELKNELLGYKDFLQRYVTIVNYQRRQFSIRRPFHNRPCPICRPRGK
jgi:hypothetical protein